MTAVPGAEARFRANLDVAVELAGRLRCRHPQRPLRQPRLGVDAGPVRRTWPSRTSPWPCAAADRVGARSSWRRSTRSIPALRPQPASADVIDFLDRARDRSASRRGCSFDAYHVVMGGEAPRLAFVARTGHASGTCSSRTSRADMSLGRARSTSWASCASHRGVGLRRLGRTRVPAHACRAVRAGARARRTQGRCRAYAAD